jgi:hypothetical protein
LIRGKFSLFDCAEEINNVWNLIKEYKDPNKDNFKSKAREYAEGLKDRRNIVTCPSNWRY